MRFLFCSLLVGILFICNINVGQSQEFERRSKHEYEINIEVGKLLSKANQEDIKVLLRLGDIFSSETHIRNLEQAKYWYSKADKKGSPTAKRKLKELQVKETEK